MSVIPMEGEVVGSNPAAGRKSGVAQLVRARKPDCHTTFASTSLVLVGGMTIIVPFGRYQAGKNRVSAFLTAIIVWLILIFLPIFVMSLL